MLTRGCYLPDMATPLHPDAQAALLDEVPEMPGEDLTEEEWYAAWTPVLERRLEEMRSGAVQGKTWEEVQAHVRAALERVRRQREP
jgi:hypothetical protein